MSSHVLIRKKYPAVLLATAACMVGGAAVLGAQGEAPAAPTINSGDTAWMLISTALVLLISAVIFEQWPDMPAVAGIALITAGIVVINLGSQTAAQ